MRHDDAITSNKASSSNGFTIIELLVGMGIMSVLIATFVAFFGKTLDVAKSLDIQNELLADGQIAQQIAASRLQEGWYILPNGHTLTLNIGWRTQNPITNAYVWTIGTHPMLAVVLPPRSLAVTCASSTDGCYRFYAIYAIKRSLYVTSTASDLSNRLPADTNNSNAWVLMQAECTLNSAAVTTGGTALNSGYTFTTCQSNLLADYMTPIVSNDYQPFTINGLNQVSLDLRFSRNAKGRTFSVGGTNSPLKAAILLRNHNIAAPTQGVE
jgi:prepilin-type N-terminal cleavage/methylation domain-containing protein